MNLQQLHILIKNGLYHRSGRCNVCGKQTLFICVDTNIARNSMTCLFCRSSSRKRHVAQQLLTYLNIPGRSLNAISANLNKKIFNTTATDSITKVLSCSNSYVCSEYFPGVAPGSLKNGILCQDLQSLTFDAQCFDVVITEDVLEHVADPQKAFAEIHRVLKPNGVHIFTIPYHFNEKSVQRATIQGNTIHHLLPEAYHTDSDGKQVLVFTDFGVDVFDQLNQAGFSTQIHFSRYLELKKFSIADSYVFISHKK